MNIKSWIIEIGNWLKDKWLAFLAIVGVGVLLAQVIPAPKTITEQDIISKIEISQEVYFQEHGRYWQGLPTHKNIPNTTTTLNNISIKPFYQAEKWSDLVELPNKLPFQIEVHQYEAPKGHGYQIFLRNEKGVKSIGYGVESESRTWEIIKTATTTHD